jgi:hypothetical protein
VTALLQYKPLVRLPSTDPVAARRARHGGILGWYAPYALGALGLTAALAFDWVPARALFESLLSGSADRPSSGFVVPSEARHPPLDGPGGEATADSTRGTIPATAGVVFDLGSSAEDDGSELALAQPDAPAWPRTGSAARRAHRAPRGLGLGAALGSRAVRTAFRAAFGGEPTARGPSRQAPGRARRMSPVAEAETEADSGAPTGIALLDALGLDLGAADALEARGEALLDAPEGSPAPSHRSRGRAPSGPAGTISVGQSCEAAQAAAVQHVEIGGPAGPPDLSVGAYASVLNRASYFQHCGAPAGMRIRICAAVQLGRAVGVTVRTEPADRSVGRCIARAVRGLAFPSHPRLDVATTSFEPF